MTERPMRILITGSRHHEDYKLIRDSIHQAWYDAGMPEKVTVVHGAARGADTLAAKAAHFMGFDQEAHPADWNRFGASAGPKRNAKMALLGADICLAFPLGDSRGTWDCVSAARARQIPVVIHETEAGE